MSFNSTMKLNATLDGLDAILIIRQLVLLTGTTCALAVSVFVMYALSQAKERSSFILGSISMSASDSVYMVINGFYVVPVTLAQAHGLAIGTVGRILGTIMATVCWKSFVATFFQSANRFTALWMPTKYARLFSIKRTYIIIVALWLVSLALSAPHLTEGCAYVYVPADQQWVRGGNCTIGGFSLEDGTYMLIGIGGMCMIVLNVLTTMRLLMRRSKVGAAQSRNPQEKEKAKKEKTFYICTAFNTFMLFWPHISAATIAKLVDGAAWEYLWARLPFLVMVSSNALILLFTNPDVKVFISEKMKQGGSVKAGGNSGTKSTEKTSKQNQGQVSSQVAK